MTERLVLEVTPDERRQLKTLAAFSGMTMKGFILSKTLGLKTSRQTQSGTAQDETDRIQSSKTMTKRLATAMVEKPSKRRSFNTIAEVRHALGIRK